MKAAVIERFEAPLVIREVDVPVIGPEEVLIRVRACGLCGTDLKILSGKFSETPLPLIPGHEIAGEVQEIGSQVKGVSVGDRVVVYIYFSCGVCRFCKAGRDSLCEDSSGHIGFDVNGGMAEFVKAPASSVMHFGSSLSFPQAAALPDAASTVFHALVTRAGLKAGESLVILGVGGLGLNAVQIARTIGAKVFAVDIKDKHLEKATELGAEVALNHDRDDIVEAISHYTKLRKAGKEYIGKCPFHQENHPSLQVSQQKQVFYCFSCQRKGDVVNFIMQIENLDTKQACLFLSKGLDNT